MTEPTPTLADMAEAVGGAHTAYEMNEGQAAKDGGAWIASRRASLTATAALLRRLSDPSDEVLERMARKFEVHLVKHMGHGDPHFDREGFEGYRAATIEGIRAALSELLP